MGQHRLGQPRGQRTLTFLTSEFIDRPRSTKLAGDRIAYSTVNHHRTLLHVVDLETLRRSDYMIPVVSDMDPDEHVHECFLTPSIAGFVARSRLYWTIGKELQYKKLLADAAVFSAHDTRIVVVHDPPFRSADGKLTNIWTFDMTTKQESAMYLHLAQKGNSFEDVSPYGVLADEFISIFYIDVEYDSEDECSRISINTDGDCLEPLKFTLSVETFSYSGQRVSKSSVDHCLGDESYWDWCSRKLHVSKAGYRQYSLHGYSGDDPMTLLIDVDGEKVDILCSTYGKETACWKNNLYILDQPVVRCVRWDGVMWPISKLTGMNCDNLTCMRHHSREIVINDDWMVVAEDHANLLESGALHHFQTIHAFSFKHDRSMQWQWSKADQWRITKYCKPVS